MSRLGLLFVLNKSLLRDLSARQAVWQWYDAKHFPKLNSCGFKRVCRYEAADVRSEYDRPFLTLCSVPDSTVLHNERIDSIFSTEQIIPRLVVSSLASPVLTGGINTEEEVSGILSVDESLEESTSKRKEVPSLDDEEAEGRKKTRTDASNLPEDDRQAGTAHVNPSHAVQDEFELPDTPLPPELDPQLIEDGLPYGNAADAVQWTGTDPDTIDYQNYPDYDPDQDDMEVDWYTEVNLVEETPSNMFEGPFPTEGLKIRQALDLDLRRYEQFELSSTETNEENRGEGERYPISGLLSQHSFNGITVY